MLDISPDFANATPQAYCIFHAQLAVHVSRDHLRNKRGQDSHLLSLLKHRGGKKHLPAVLSFRVDFFFGFGSILV